MKSSPYWLGCCLWSTNCSVEKCSARSYDECFRRCLQINAQPKAIFFPSSSCISHENKKWTWTLTSLLILQPVTDDDDGGEKNAIRPHNKLPTGGSSALCRATRSRGHRAPYFHATLYVNQRLLLNSQWSTSESMNKRFQSVRWCRMTKKTEPSNRDGPASIRAETTFDMFLSEAAMLCDNQQL